MENVFGQLMQSPNLLNCGVHLKASYEIIYRALLYRNGLKNREFDKEAFQNSDLERVTIVRGQGASEDLNFEGKLTNSCYAVTLNQYGCSVFFILPRAFASDPAARSAYPVIFSHFSDRRKKKYFNRIGRIARKGSRQDKRFSEYIYTACDSKIVSGSVASR